MKPETLYYIQREENVAGPYDLVQMAGLLRKKIITSETMSRREGEEDWKPFSWQPQFSLVGEIPADATSSRVGALEEEAAAANAPPIMLPSRETVLKIVGLASAMLLLGVGSCLIALLSSTIGWALLLGGIGAASIAYCLIIARMLDEDGGTLLKIMFIPYYDNYYFLTISGSISTCFA